MENQVLENFNQLGEIALSKPSATKTQNEIDEECRTANVLGSWFYFASKNALQKIHGQFAEDKKVNLMLDSGVFTFRKKGMDVDIDKYINFLNDNVKYISQAVTLDYPHDPEIIIKNTDYIRERLDPKIELVPVIQSYIFNREQVEYILANYNYICVGTYDGIHKTIRYSKDVDDSLKDILELNKIYNKKLHGLGRTKATWLKNNEWVYSTDSSGFARYIFTGMTAMYCNKKADVVNTQKDERFTIMKYFKYYQDRFNLTYNELYECVAKSNHLIADDYPHNALCALVFILIQEHTRLINPKYRVLLATSNYSNFGAVDKALDLYYNRNKEFDPKPEDYGITSAVI